MLAPKVVQAAQQGDTAAVEILRTAGEELARTALGVMRQLLPPGAAMPVYMTGGVFQAGALLLDPFRRFLAREWPEAEPRAPRFPPAVGSAILAARSLGIEVDRVWLDNVAATLPGVLARRPW